MDQATATRFLIELRKRVGWSLASLVVLSMITFCFSNRLYTALAMPLLKQFTADQHLIATNILSAFFTPFDLAFYCALFLAIPVFLYHIWAFVAPALYPTEKRMIWPLLLASIVLFYLGAVFAYAVIFPILFAFLAHAAPNGVQVTPDIAEYLDFTLRFFLIFGIIFEIPVILILLVKAKLITYEKLVQLRPYIIVLAFIIGMLIAPPDILSQTVVAIPLWWLYEVGVLILLAERWRGRRDE